MFISGTSSLLRHDAFGWEFIAYGAVSLLFGTLMLGWQRSFVGPQLASAVAFTEHGIEITYPGERAGGKVRFVPFVNVGSLQSKPEGLLVFARRHIALPLFIIPRSAMQDGGAAVTAFFEDRLIGKHLLHRSPRATLIVNSASQR